MAISKRTLKALRRDLARLIAKKQRLRKELAEVEREVEAIQNVVALDNKSPETTARHEAPAAPPVKVGWKAHIFSLLEKNPSGMTIKEMTNQLTQQGVKPSGKTPLRVMLWSEAGRLQKAGVLSKGQGGRFSRAK